jgi:hypothetical protein
MQRRRKRQRYATESEIEDGGKAGPESKNDAMKAKKA